jgi:hypothetical protein
MMDVLPFVMLAAVLGWWAWVAYHNHRNLKEWREHPVDLDEYFAAEAERNRRLEEMEQKIRQWQAELAALKRPAA